MGKRSYRIKEHTRCVTMRFSTVATDKKGYLKAREAINCECRNGVIKNAMSWSRFKWSNGKNIAVPETHITGAFVTREYLAEEKQFQERIGVIGEYGNVYIETPTENKFTCIATGVNQATVASVGEGVEFYKGIFGDGKALLVDGSGAVKALTDLTDSTMGGAYYRHRLFVGVRPSGVAYSEPENVGIFTKSLYDAGEIRFADMGSDVIAMKVFKDKLYLFFDHGIMMMENCGSPIDFKTKTFAYAGGKILGKTVCVANSSIFFMATDGLFRFDGVKVEKVLSGFVQIPYGETGKESAAAAGEKIFIHYAQAASTFVTLVVYEDGKDAYYVTDMEGVSRADDGRILFRDRNGVMSVLKESGDYVILGTFDSEETDFGIAGRKTLRKLVLKGRGECYLTVTCGLISIQYTLDLTSGCMEIPMNFNGERFQFQFLMLGGSKIEEMTAVLKSARREYDY